MFSFKPVVPEPLRASTLCMTGFSGYVGRHLLASLRQAGHRPFIIGRPGREPAALEGAQTARRWDSPAELALQLADLRDPVILNIAGHFVSRHGPSDIPVLVSGNLEFPLMIFEALSLSGHKRIVNIGTSWEFSDTGAPEPANLYAQLKASNALALDYFARQTPLRAINLKLNDTYGGNDTRDKLMPLLKQRWRDGQPAALRASRQKINLLHLTDVLEGLLAAAVETASLADHACRTAFLLGNETVTLETLAVRLTSSIATTLTISFETTSPVPGLRQVWEGAPRLDSWSPRISLEAGLRNYFRETP